MQKQIQQNGLQTLTNLYLIERDCIRCFCDTLKVTHYGNGVSESAKICSFEGIKRLWVRKCPPFPLSLETQNKICKNQIDPIKVKERLLSVPNIAKRIFIWKSQQFVKQLRDNSMRLYGHCPNSFCHTCTLGHLFCHKLSTQALLGLKGLVD